MSGIEGGPNGGTTHVDGYLIPVPIARLEEYRRFSRKVAAVYREHGATRIVDCRLDETVSNDEGFHAEGARDELADGGGPLRDFRDACGAERGEAVVLSWTEWPSKEARRVGLARALADPRLQPRDGEEAIFEGRRLVAGSFLRLLDSASD